MAYLPIEDYGITGDLHTAALVGRSGSIDWLCFPREARHFMDWLQTRAGELEPDGALQIMDGIDGRHRLPEEILDHLEGYRGIRPVRTGNAAHAQLQLDIDEEIMAKGGNPARRAFVQAYGSQTLDASVLLMPLVFFLSPTHPRMLSTLEAIQRGLVSDSLVHRYDQRLVPDGLQGEEGTFSICTFWLVEALTRAGRLEEARLMFDKTLGYANHLGLYAEQIGRHGEVLGNFPQAFTPLSLIGAAYNLDRALDRNPAGPHR